MGNQTERGSGLSDRIVEALRSLGVRSAYGEPIDVDGVTIVPVAIASYGLGVGESEPGSEDGTAGGSGGGGGGTSIPIGAYVRRADGVRFEPNVIALLAVGIPFCWVAGRALAKVVRALKK